MKVLYITSVFLIYIIIFFIYFTNNNSLIYGQSSSPYFITKWGSQGSGDGQFNSPRGIEVDTYGNVYVADAGNHRIQKFDDRHLFIMRLGSQGSGDGQFNSPFDIAIDSSGIAFVTDNQNNNVQGFYNSTIIMTFGTLGQNDGEFRGITGISIDPQGNLYVPNYASPQRVQKFTYDGKFIGWIGKCNAGANCDTNNQRAKDFGCNSNTCTPDNYGSGDGQFWIPTFVSEDKKNDSIYISDTYNHRVQKFTYDGKFIGWIGKCNAGANCDTNNQRGERLWVQYKLLFRTFQWISSWPIQFPIRYRC